VWEDAKRDIQEGDLDALRVAFGLDVITKAIKASLHSTPASQPAKPLNIISPHPLHLPRVK